MTKILAFCGLRCDTCPIYLATREKSEERKYDMRLAIALQCNEKYNTTLEAEDISDCDGCTAVAGKLFKGCWQCEIRKCALSKNLTTCAYCDDFGCEKLQQHFCLDPESLQRLESLQDHRQ